MNLAEITSSDLKFPEIAFAVDLIKFILNEHQIKIPNNPALDTDRKRFFTKDFGNTIKFTMIVCQDIFDQIIVDFFSNDIFSPSFLFMVSQEMLGDNDETIFFVQLTRFCAFVSHLCILYARLDKFQIVGHITNILVFSLLQHGYRFLDINSWKDFCKVAEEYNRYYKIAEAA